MPRSGKKTEKGAERFFGEVSILTDYIRKGVTQTNHDPAFQTGVGYEFSPSFRLGIWGSNVNYENESVHLNLKAYFSYRFFMTANANLLLRHDLDRYYKSTSRNGTNTSLDLTLFSYHVLYLKDDNWEGTQTQSSWFAFRKEFPYSASTAIEATAGYSMVDVNDYNNYIDLKAAYIYRENPIKLSAEITMTSNASQFNGRGNMALALQVATQF